MLSKDSTVQASTHTDIGHRHYEREEYAEAAAEYAAAIDVDPRTEVGYLYLALSDQKLGHYGSGKPGYRVDGATWT